MLFCHASPHHVLPGTFFWLFIISLFLWKQGFDMYCNTLHNILRVYLSDLQALLHDVSIVMLLSYPSLKELDMI